MIDANGSVMFAIDLQGQVIRWNRAAATLTGISEDQIRGRVFHETTLFQDNGRHWSREFDRILASRSGTFFETRWKIHDSSLVTLTCACSPVADSEGQVEFIVCSAAKSLTHDLLNDRIAEMHALSRFFHDTVSQNLVALSFTIGHLESAAAKEPLRSDFESATKLIERCCRDIRVICSVLAAALPETPLDASIEHLGTFVRDETGMPILLDLEPVPDATLEAQMLMFSAFQSWIARAVRSRAKPAVFGRLRSRRAGAHLSMDIAPPPPGFLDGWTFFAERALALGGEFGIDADSGRVTASLSLPGQVGE